MKSELFFHLITATSMTSSTSSVTTTASIRSREEKAADRYDRRHLSYLEKFILTFSSLSFVIRFNLLLPYSHLLRCGLTLLRLECFVFLPLLGFRLKRFSLEHRKHFALALVLFCHAQAIDTKSRAPYKPIRSKNKTDF